MIQFPNLDTTKVKLILGCQRAVISLSITTNMCLGPKLNRHKVRGEIILRVLIPHQEISILMGA